MPRHAGKPIFSPGFTALFIYTLSILFDPETGFSTLSNLCIDGGKKPNGMLPNPPWIISIKDYGNSLGISCFVKVYSRATCSLQPYKYDSVTSVPPNSFFFFFFFSSHFVLQHRASCQDVWGCQHAAVHVDTMCVPCGGAYSKLG